MAGIVKVRLYGRHRTPASEPRPKAMVFEAVTVDNAVVTPIPAVLDASGDIIVEGSTTAVADKWGNWSVDLYPSTGAATNPTTFLYRETGSGIVFSLPAGSGPKSWRTVVPAPPAAATYLPASSLSDKANTSTVTALQTQLADHIANGGEGGGGTDPDAVVGASGTGGYMMVMEGDPAPATDKTILTLLEQEDLPSSGGAGRPAGMDVDGGQVGWSVDPASAVIPATGATEGYGAIAIQAGQRVAVMVRIFSDTVTRMIWRAAPDAKPGADVYTPSVPAELAIVDAAGTILRQTASGAILPGGVIGSTGSEQGWTFTPITGLTPGTDLYLLMKPTAVARLFASGVGPFVNNSGKKTAAAVARAAKTPTASMPPPALASPVDLAAGWERCAVPVVIASRTA